MMRTSVRANPGCFRSDKKAKSTHGISFDGSEIGTSGKVQDPERGKINKSQGGRLRRRS